MALPSLGMGSIRLGVLALEVAMKKALIAIGIVVVLLIVVALALPFLIDVNRFKPTLEADLSMALGRKVEIGNIQLALLQGSVKSMTSPSPTIRSSAMRRSCRRSNSRRVWLCNR